MRLWLQQYNEYIDFISKIILAVMGIFVSYASFLVSQGQLKAASEANSLAKLQYLPTYSAKIDFTDRKKDKQEEFIISKAGGQAFEFESNPIAFYSINEVQVISIAEKSSRYPSKAMKVPLDGYFPPAGYVQNDNPIFRTTIKYDDSYFTNEREFLDKHISSNKYLNGKVEPYLMIKFKDQFGDLHHEYFKFDVSGLSVPISRQEGEAVFESYKKYESEKLYLNFYDFKEKDIEKLWLDLAH